MDGKGALCAMAVLGEFTGCVVVNYGHNCPKSQTFGQQGLHYPSKLAIRVTTIKNKTGVSVKMPTF